MTARSKYNNRITVIDNHRFHSLAEAHRYGELKLLALAGKIRNLTLQPCYPIRINGEHICNYIGDFEYVDCTTNQRVTEDVKSEATVTQVYILKRKLMLAVHHIKIVEVM